MEPNNNKYEQEYEFNYNCGGFEWPSENQTKLMCTTCTRRWLVRSQHPWWKYLWDRVLLRLGNTPAAERYLCDEKGKLDKMLTETLRKILTGHFPGKLYQVLPVWLEKRVVTAEGEFREMKTAAEGLMRLAWSRPLL